MTSLICCISIVVSPPSGSSSFPAYRGSALMKTMPSSLLPLVFSHPRRLLLLKLGFSTKLHLHCLHFPRVCGLCHHLHLQSLATCQATTWLVEIRPAAGHPSPVLSQAFHDSNFAILAICPHTLAGRVL